MREGDELQELSVLVWDRGQPRCMLRAVLSGLALVLSAFGFMGFGELCMPMYSYMRCGQAGKLVRQLYYQSN